MGEDGETNEILLSAWDAGGPNDPTVAFKGLNEQLHAVKEELSPWGWRAYHTEFKDRQMAERRLRAMAAMPGSGSEPKDGVIKGTPLWQERLDHLLLVEHLKKKIMLAHTRFSDASELFLKSHGWLVQDYHLADLFVKFITSVPESAHDRVDYLQAQLEQTRKEVINVRHEFEDYVAILQRNRVDFVKRTLEHQKVKNARALKDDVMIRWSYGTQICQLTKLRRRNESLQDRCMSLELGNAEMTEFIKESQRRWTEDKTQLTKERDDYYKKWQKMVKAHEQAMADLKRSEGTAEGQRMMILTLSQEKAALEVQVEELEEQVRVMAKQLAELRDELAKIRQEVRRLTQQLKETEAVLVTLA
jgi:DNA repair exonuclease SbcCD ATPase subunit